jgi:hypothetical protein
MDGRGPTACRQVDRVKAQLVASHESAYGRTRLKAEGQSVSALPPNSDVNLFRYPKRVIYLDAEVADRALCFGRSGGLAPISFPLFHGMWGQFFEGHSSFSGMVVLLKRSVFRTGPCVG